MRGSLALVALRMRVSYVICGVSVLCVYKECDRLKEYNMCIERGLCRLIVFCRWSKYGRKDNTVRGV